MITFISPIKQTSPIKNPKTVTKNFLALELFSENRFCDFFMAFKIESTETRMA